MAEFALALPILLLVLLGLLEVGRAVFMFASVTNASREAVRFATAYGVNESDVLHYQNCEEIRNAAQKVAFLVPLADEDIQITYDAGPDASGVIQPLAGSPECAPAETIDSSITLTCGDRVVVSVTVDYLPIVPIIPMQAQAFDASSARTFMGVIELSDDFTGCD